VATSGSRARGPGAAGPSGRALDVEPVVHQLAEEVLRRRRCRAAPRPPRRPRGTGPSRSSVCTSPDGHPVVAIRPLPYVVQQLAVHPGLVEEPLEARQRGHPEEVVHARGVLGQQRHVGVGAAAGDVVVAAVVPSAPGCGRAARARGDVRLDADDRLDPVLARRPPELVGAEDVAVVGGGHGGHAHPGGLAEQVVDPGRAVQHRVLGVHVQVHEGVAGRRSGRHEAPPEGSSRAARTRDRSRDRRRGTAGSTRSGPGRTGPGKGPAPPAAALLAGSAGIRVGAARQPDDCVRRQHRHPVGQFPASPAASQDGGRVGPAARLRRPAHGTPAQLRRERAGPVAASD
jgi:hypothetical protein